MGSEYDFQSMIFRALLIPYPSNESKWDGWFFVCSPPMPLDEPNVAGAASNTKEFEKQKHLLGWYFFTLTEGATITFIPQYLCCCSFLLALEHCNAGDVLNSIQSWLVSWRTSQSSSVDSFLTFCDALESTPHSSVVLFLCNWTISVLKMKSVEQDVFPHLRRRRRPLREALIDSQFRCCPGQLNHPLLRG